MTFFFLWKIAFKNFDGKLLPGPFSKLIQLFSLIGWSISSPPLIYDHLGLQHNLCTADKTWLLFQLKDACFKLLRRAPSIRRWKVFLVSASI